MLFRELYSAAFFPACPPANADPVLSPASHPGRYHRQRTDRLLLLFAQLRQIFNVRVQHTRYRLRRKFTGRLSDRTRCRAVPLQRRPALCLSLRQFPEALNDTSDLPVFKRDNGHF